TQQTPTANVYQRVIFCYRSGVVRVRGVRTENTPSRRGRDISFAHNTPPKTSAKRPGWLQKAALPLVPCLCETFPFKIIITSARCTRHPCVRACVRVCVYARSKPPPPNVCGFPSQLQPRASESCALLLGVSIQNILLNKCVAKTHEQVASSIGVLVTRTHTQARACSRAYLEAFWGCNIKPHPLRIIRTPPRRNVAG
uniref:Uncharacterized protein n=1 Tax=Anopheles dirus TaxID=7168 RepID=A0A182NF03_9DIPT